MIAYLRGEVKYISGGWIVLDVNGVGYKVFTNSPPLQEGEEAEYFIHHHMREDSEDLYGFASYEAMNLFELLLSVSGVGPKVALAIMATGAVTKIRQAIARGDTTALTSVGGVGKKVASKIIVELKNKLGGEGSYLPEEGGENEEVLDALEQLGYKKPEIAPLLRDMPEDLQGTQAKLTWVLQRIKK